MYNINNETQEKSIGEGENKISKLRYYYITETN